MNAATDARRRDCIVYSTMMIIIHPSFRWLVLLASFACAAGKKELKNRDEVSLAHLLRMPTDQEEDYANPFKNPPVLSTFDKLVNAEEEQGADPSSSSLLSAMNPFARRPSNKKRKKSAASKEGARTGSSGSGGGGTTGAIASAAACAPGFGLLVVVGGGGPAAARPRKKGGSAGGGKRVGGGSRGGGSPPPLPPPPPPLPFEKRAAADGGLRPTRVYVINDDRDVHRWVAFKERWSIIMQLSRRRRMARGGHGWRAVNTTWDEALHPIRVRAVNLRSDHGGGGRGGVEPSSSTSPSYLSSRAAWTRRLELLPVRTRRVALTCREAAAERGPTALAALEYSLCEYRCVVS